MENKTEESKYSSIHYSKYLQLDKLLDAQHVRSAEFGEPAHEEMLFIVVHQVYELWFKQVIHELSSIKIMFEGDQLDERKVGIAVHRLSRVIDIFKLLIQQIGVLETMTPLDFLDFRNYLFPASGFQSMQFRKVEVLLGLSDNNRITYNNTPYKSVFSEKEREEMMALENSPSLKKLVEEWLERTPFLEFGGFVFLEKYEQAVHNMINREKEAIMNSSVLGEEEKAQRLRMLGDTDTYYKSVMDKNTHDKLREEGKVSFSYKATIAALLINLYRDEPILRMPFELLTRLLDIDEQFTLWRYRHAQMVLRMLGRKIGTGGSSGYDYLKKTSDMHHIFSDLYNVSTLLIPRSELPPLPVEIRKELGFYFSEMKHPQ